MSKVLKPEDFSPLRKAGGFGFAAPEVAVMIGVIVGGREGTLRAGMLTVGGFGAIGIGEGLGASIGGGRIAGTSEAGVRICFVVPSLETVFTSSSFIGAIPAAEGAILEAIEDCGIAVIVVEPAKLTVGWV